MAQEKLHRFHIMLMMLNTQSGIALFTLPRITAHHFGTNGWLSLIIVFLFASLNTMLISAVYRLGRGTSVFEILRDSLPRVILYPLYLLIGSNLAMFGYLRFPFVERIHNFLLSMYLFSVVHTGAMYYWASKAMIKQVFPRVPPKLLLALTMAATIAVSLTPDSLMDVEWWLRNITLVQLAFSVGFPLLLILLLFIQRREKKHA
ncbi:hypothetical protein EHV15_15635 [Paenibacillus oralis]|uniref:Uncharacterized protein n=1 Tax=Paenibacillus oralis TaxID=2490856 RepID=A0A3P3U1H5_9BACL|nr:GerAB/ArcD/ProY family transporter [Paenibacillus oralis]RRJ64192.1 hypothetical protein EHV15_15635 [Paenibacillus oralis]